MQAFDIIKETKIEKKSYRVAKLYDQFDLNEDVITERFSGKIELPESWNIGIIVGKSGTGKTTIAKELFGDGFVSSRYINKSVIDDFPQSVSEEVLFKTLSSVGFSSPPSWLKPYEVLSNGEKMRVDLAMALLNNKEYIVFDEYTSVVDREVAQIGSLAVQRAIKKENKKFIAVSCHFDIIKWLEPDWVFNTDTMEFSITRGLLRRPEVKITIREQKGYWKMFSKYHYMNHSAVSGAIEHVAFYEDKPIALVSWIHFPHNKYRMLKVHRFVVHPDYQGIGIGKKILNISAEEMLKTGAYIGITTSLNEFSKSLMRDKKWLYIRGGKAALNLNIKALNKSVTNNRNTYSFRYIGESK
jgi:ABC-type lipoprotein export system ATPase subunit